MLFLRLKVKKYKDSDVMINVTILIYKSCDCWYYYVSYMWRERGGGGNNCEISRWERGTEPRDLALLVRIKVMGENLCSPVFPCVASSNGITRFARHLWNLASHYSAQGVLVTRTRTMGEVHHVMIVVPCMLIFTLHNNCIYLWDESDYFDTCPMTVYIIISDLYIAWYIPRSYLSRDDVYSTWMFTFINIYKRKQTFVKESLIINHSKCLPHATKTERRTLRSLEGDTNLL